MNILMAKPRPLVSVCMPTYNGLMYVKQAIDSLTQQAMPNFELVICDDAPFDDNTGIFAYGLAKEYGFRVKRLSNSVRLGIAGSLNKAINHSKGKWIKPLFQDDVLSDSCLISMLNATEGDPYRLVVAKREFIVDSKTDNSVRALEFAERKSIDCNFSSYQPICSREFSEHIKWKLWDNFVGEPTSVLFSRKLYKRLGGFDSQFIQLLDWDFWCRAGTNWGLYYIPEALSKFRLHKGAATSTNMEFFRYRATVLDPVHMLSKMCSLEIYKKFRSIVGGEHLVNLLIKTLKFARDVADKPHELEAYQNLLCKNYYIYNLALMIGVTNATGRDRRVSNRMSN